MRRLEVIENLPESHQLYAESKHELIEGLSAWLRVGERSEAGRDRTGLLVLRLFPEEAGYVSRLDQFSRSTTTMIPSCYQVPRRRK